MNKSKGVIINIHAGGVMKKQLSRISALCTAAALIFTPQFGAVTAVNAETSSNATTVTTKDDTAGVPTESKITLYDADGNAVPIGTDVDYTKDIQSLKSNITTGMANASKNGAFESSTDAENGIAKLTFDVAGKTADPAYDVVLVLDESGSMNMSMSTAKDGKGRDKYSAGRHMALCPDQNPDHYYCIPASLGYGNTEDIYFHLSDFGADAFTIWSSMNSIWEEIKTSYGLNTEASIEDWQPWKHLFKKVNNEYVQIPLFNTTKKYTSPINDDENETNSDGCFDRMMLEKEQASIFANEILDSSSNANVAVVGFNGTATTRCGLTNDMGTVTSALKNYDGDDNTNYTQALSAAQAILASRTDKEIPAYVVFITDGNPYYDDTQKDDASNEQTAIDALHADSTVYAVGIHSNATEELQRVAGKNGYSSDCTTNEEFKSLLNSLFQKISNNPVLTDTIGADYALLLDQNHPLTVGSTSYTSLNDLPNTIQYDADAKKFTWTVSESLLDQGQRMTFYVQLDASKRETSAGSGAYDTNGEAELTYHKVVDGKQDENETTVTLNSPSIHYTETQLPAVLTSDHMTDNNPNVIGTKVSTGDVVTYTVTVSNTGDIDAENVSVKDYIPQYTEFNAVVSGDGTYSSKNNSIAWTIPSIPAGKSAIVQFSVKVKDVDSTTELETITDTFKWGWGTAKDYTVKDPNCQGNILNNPTSKNTPVTSDHNRETLTTPNTGDQTNTAGAACACGISVCMALLAILFKKKYAK